MYTVCYTTPQYATLYFVALICNYTFNDIKVESNISSTDKKDIVYSKMHTVCFITVTHISDYGGLHSLNSIAHQGL